MTLGTAAACVRLIVWCKGCQHQVEPDPFEMAARYGAEMPVLDWRERLVCSRRGSRQADMVAWRSEPVVGGGTGDSLCPCRSNASDGRLNWLPKACTADEFAPIRPASNSVGLATSYPWCGSPSFNVGMAPSSYLKAVTVHTGVV